MTIQLPSCNNRGIIVVKFAYLKRTVLSIKRSIVTEFLKANWWAPPLFKLVMFELLIFQNVNFVWTFCIYKNKNWSKRGRCVHLIFKIDLSTMTSY